MNADNPQNKLFPTPDESGGSPSPGVGPVRTPGAPKRTGAHREPHTDLALRLVACEQWRWLPGMATPEVPNPGHVLPLWDACLVLSEDEEVPEVYPTFTGRLRRLHEGAIPDLRHPATLGCLESMVERFHAVNVAPDGEWRCCVYGHRVTREQPFWSTGATKGEALARALLRQWGEVSCG